MENIAPAPTVSVIIPTYNRAHVLTRALESVLAQTFEDFEVLVVDDGSTDGTAALMAEYEARDERVRYLVQPQNAGVSAARNRGLREVRGAYIALLDSDDEWLPAKLERQVARFEELPDEVGLLYGGVEDVGPGGVRAVHTPEHRGDLSSMMLRRNVIHGTSGVMIRRAAAERAGYFDEGIPAIEDWDYWIRVTRHFEVDFVSEPLIRYHDPAGVERKSLNTEENIDARAWLYRMHGAEMRRAGTAHHFLLESARRHLNASPPDLRAVRRLALAAVRARPLVRAPYRMLLRAFAPAAVLRVIRTARRIGSRPGHS